MAQFKVGGKVVAIETRISTNTAGHSVTIVKGKVYTVLGIKTCPCGHVTLDVGFLIPKVSGYRNASKCSRCEGRTVTDVWYLRSSSFAPIEEQEYRQVTYTKIIDEIPVCAQ